MGRGHGFRDGLIGALLALPALAAAEPATVDRQGVTHFPAFDVPLSPYMSEAGKQAFIDRAWVPFKVVTDQGIAVYRQTFDQNFLAPRLARAKQLYPVKIHEDHLSGVRVDVVEPAEGIGARAQGRVLINLHGGSFRVGGGMGGLVESIPIAGLAKLAVISVDYRQWPEARHPAAVVDTVAVYRALLQTHRPQDIGLFGCSAGGVLVAMTVVKLQQEKLPPPGAVGILCAPAEAMPSGDSFYLSAAFDRQSPPTAHQPPPRPEYFEGADPSDPLLTPIQHPDLLARFPPTLFITGTRSAELSSAAASHAALIKAGVDAELHVFEGMVHGFVYDVDVPEARDAFAVIARFFDRHLGRTGR